MPRFENNIMGLIPRDEWLDIPFVVNRPADPIDQLFGDVKTDNIVAYWENIAAEYQVPLMAQFHGFDTEAQQTFRIPVDTQSVEKGLIKVKINQSERMRALMRSGVQNDQMYELYIRFYQVQMDIDRMTDPEAKAQMEETKKELIAKLETNR